MAGVERDSVDRVIEQWTRERADLDFAPVAVLGRLQKIATLVNKEIQAFAAAHGLDQSELDVLMTLRRSGAPFALTPTALLRSALVTSGAITNRIDRLEAKGLVRRVRRGHDRRSLQVELTETGRERVDELIILHLANEKQLLAVADLDLDTLSSQLRQLLMALESP